MEDLEDGNGPGGIAEYLWRRGERRLADAGVDALYGIGAGAAGAMLAPATGGFSMVPGYGVAAMNLGRAVEGVGEAANYGAAARNFKDMGPEPSFAPPMKLGGPEPEDFDTAFSNLQKMLIDLDGDGEPDAVMPAPPEMAAPVVEKAGNAMAKYSGRQQPAFASNTNAMAAAAHGPGIADELAQSPPTPAMARAGMAPTGEVRSYQPTRGEDASFQLRQSGPVGNAMAGAAQGLLDYGGIPAEIVTDIARQPVRAGQAVGDAVLDPTLANVTNAGVQTALSFGVPRVAAALGAGGMLEAARRDFAPVISPASAQSLTRRQRREQEMRDMEAAREREAEAGRVRVESEARRQEADAAARREAESKRDDLRLQEERAKQAEWDRAVQRSEDAFAGEMGRVRRFSDSKSYTKAVADKVGGLAPFLGGAAGGLAARAAGAGRLGQIAGGAGGGITATSAPLFEDAYFTDVDNPERSAYISRGAELPPGHPRKQEFIDHGRSLPEENPVRRDAREQLYNPVRLGLSGAEGAFAGLFGGDVLQGGRRIFNAMANARGGASSSGNAMARARNGVPQASAASERVLIRDSAGRHRTPDGRFASPPGE